MENNLTLNNNFWKSDEEYHKDMTNHHKIMAIIPTPVAPISNTYHAIKAIQHDKKRKSARKIKEAYKLGYDFLNEAEPKYLTLIGGLQYKSVPSGYWCERQDFKITERNNNTSCKFEKINRSFFANPENIMYAKTIVSSPTECTTNYAVVTPQEACTQNFNYFSTRNVYTRYEMKQVYIPNDGFVLHNSAIGWDACDPRQKVKMEKTNHQQMRNNEALRTSLKTLYDGNYDRWFFTPEKK